MKKIIYRVLLIFLPILIVSCASRKTNPYEFALMSADVYDRSYIQGLPTHIKPFLDFDPDEYKSALNLDLDRISSLIEEKNWKKLAPYVIGKILSKGGYSGRAYINTKSAQVIIAHRGTDISYAFSEEEGLSLSIDKRLWETLKDLDDDLDILRGEIPRQQLDIARFFTRKVRETYKAKYNGKEPAILHTGHSLGAVLAELSAVDGHTQAVTFESPGSYPMVKQLIKEDSLKNPSYRITTYNTLPNSINLTHPSAGEVIYLIESPGKKVPRDAFDNAAIEAALSKHSIREVLAHFDPKTGKPKKNR